MKKKNIKKSKKIPKAEKFLYNLCGCVAILLVVGIVCSQVSLSKINFEVEKLKIEVNDQEDVNQSLEMKINEMTSLENINALSTALGLSYNNDNIKTIAE